MTGREKGKGKMYLHYLRKYSYKICQFLVSRRKENETIYSQFYLLLGSESLLQRAMLANAVAKSGQNVTYFLLESKKRLLDGFLQNFCCTKKNKVLSYREVPTQQQKVTFSEEIHTFSQDFADFACTMLNTAFSFRAQKQTFTTFFFLSKYCFYLMKC